jgi:hypothetical protein
MQLRTVWDSYWGRVIWGSVGLFVIVPVLSCVLGGGYALGVYIGTGIAVLWYTAETCYLRRETTRNVENAWSMFSVTTPWRGWADTELAIALISASLG